MITPTTPSKPQPTPTWYKLPIGVTAAGIMNRKSWLKISLGVVFVTFICPALTNSAVFHIPLGLAMSLGSITPLFALLLEWPIYRTKEKIPTVRALIGAILAVSGVVVLSIFR